MLLFQLPCRLQTLLFLLCNAANTIYVVSICATEPQMAPSAFPSGVPLRLSPTISTISPRLFPTNTPSGTPTATYHWWHSVQVENLTCMLAAFDIASFVFLVVRWRKLLDIVCLPPTSCRKRTTMLIIDR